MFFLSSLQALVPPPAIMSTALCLMDSLMPSVISVTTQFINVLRNFPGKFVNVYNNDILIYSPSYDSHATQIRKVSWKITNTWVWLCPKL